MEGKDAGSCAACAIREVTEEEMYLPADWVGPFFRALEAHPQGQTVVHMVQPSRGVVHHLALWFVRLPDEWSAATSMPHKVSLSPLRARR